VTNDTPSSGLRTLQGVVATVVDDWTEELVLEGRRVSVRQIHDDDVDRLRRLFFRLSPETVHLRFFQPLKAPSEKMLHHLAEVDHDQRQAIVAVVDDEVVAVVRYDRSADPSLAEMAIVVEDAWQGHGLGKLLLRRLTIDAMEHGVETLTATVLGENRRAMGLAHRVAPTTHTRLDHGEWYLDIPLHA
jgi:RimJ/RimL family protein N-acetyltransferase